MSVRLQTLGGLRISRDGVEHHAFAAQKLRSALLAYLAVERVVTRDAVISIFWADRDPERARHALSQAIYELRRALGAEFLDVTGDRLDASAVEVDAHEFERLVHDDLAEAALVVYAGPFLDGFQIPGNRDFEQWVDQQRARFARLHRRVRRASIEARAAAGDVAGALAGARAWASIEPLEDEAHHRVIEFLAASGERTAALQHFETYRRLVIEELEVEPLEQTQQLVARLREGETPDVGRLATLDRPRAHDTDPL
ncbi:MAG: AfsR/SARP family transcriptional regulator, partial [Longimicrobiales bacterium]